jgi:site-specific DNA-cytosine methylase
MSLVGAGLPPSAEHGGAGGQLEVSLPRALGVCAGHARGARRRVRGDPLLTPSCLRRRSHSKGRFHALPHPACHVSSLPCRGHDGPLTLPSGMANVQTSHPHCRDTYSGKEAFRRHPMPQSDRSHLPRPSLVPNRLPLRRNSGNAMNVLLAALLAQIFMACLSP